jgi:uncharacterized peroxidase-related enzyme
MPHINLPEGVPGIRSLVMYRPDTGEHLYALVQLLLRGESTLSEAERELIAAFVSYRNECAFCSASHAAAARYLFKNQELIVDQVLEDYNKANISEKLKSLLGIAAKVQQNGKAVLEQDVASAKKAGATDREIHDTVLIAATFSLFNRYVDGLATLTPGNSTEYLEMGKRLGEKGYVLPPGTPNTSKPNN